MSASSLLKYILLFHLYVFSFSSIADNLNQKIYDEIVSDMENMHRTRNVQDILLDEVILNTSADSIKSTLLIFTSPITKEHIATLVSKHNLTLRTAHYFFPAKNIENTTIGAFTELNVSNKSIEKELSVREQNDTKSFAYPHSYMFGSQAKSLTKNYQYYAIEASGKIQDILSLFNLEGDIIRSTLLYKDNKLDVIEKGNKYIEIFKGMGLITSKSTTVHKIQSVIQDKTMNASIPENLICGIAGYENCPPDITWLPSSKWEGVLPGSNAKSYAEITTTTYFWFGIPLYAERSGFVRSNIAFSSQTLNNPYDVGTVFSANTSAYQPEPESLPPCKVSFKLVEAPCNKKMPVNKYSIRVPKPSLEIENLIPNNECITFLDGCLKTTGYKSNLPGGYLDTTLFDDSSKFSATVGSFTASKLKPSTNYHTMITFGATSYFYPFFDDLTGKEMPFSGQIGTHKTSIRCLPGQPQLCVFAVDSTVLKRYIFK